MKYRDELALLFEDNRITGMGAEIGVMHGGFTQILAEKYKGTVYGVDIQETDLARERLIGNMEYIIGDSVKVSERFDDESLDFVFIDGDHTTNGVTRDYKAWFPKVRMGGVVAFHDYCEAFNDVKRFVDSLEKDLIVTTDDYWEGVAYPTAYFIK